MCRHAGHRRRHGARGSAHPGVIEQKELPFLSEDVRQRGIPVVERAREVLKEKQRKSRTAAEAAISVAFAAFHLQKLGGDRAGHIRAR
jgi:hypothetical protein